jgi:pyruvate kinase
VSFELTHTDSRRLYPDIFRTLLAHKLVEVDDLVIFTKGDLDGVTGSTNAMKILKVSAPPES